MHALSLSALLMFATSPQDGAPDTRIGDWIFRLPEGMAIRTGLDGRPALAFRDTPANFSTTVRFTHSADLEGDDVAAAFRAWAAEGRAELRRTLGVEVDGDASETRTASGYRMIAWAAPYTDERGVNWFTLLACLRKNRRAGGLMFFSNDLERVAERAATLDALLQSASFAAVQRRPPLVTVHIDPTSTPSFLWPPTAPPTGDGELRGLYGTTGLGAAGDPREGITTARFRWRHVAFFADGTVMRDLPPEGLASFRPSFWIQRFPRALGRYETTADEVRLTFPGPDGRSETERFVRRGADLVQGGATYRRLVGDDVRLRGSFLRHDWRSLSAVQRQAITFDPAGTFGDEGFNATLNIGWWVGGECELRDPTPIPGRGTWRIERHTLELLYEDGRRRRFAFHLDVDQPATFPDVVVVNGHVLVRRP